MNTRSCVCFRLNMMLIRRGCPSGLCKQPHRKFHRYRPSQPCIPGFVCTFAWLFLALKNVENKIQAKISSAFPGPVRSKSPSQDIWQMDSKKFRFEQRTSPFATSSSSQMGSQVGASRVQLPSAAHVVDFEPTNRVPSRHENLHVDPLRRPFEHSLLPPSNSIAGQFGTHFGCSGAQVASKVLKMKRKEKILKSSFVELPPYPYYCKKSSSLQRARHLQSTRRNILILFPSFLCIPFRDSFSSPVQDILALPDKRCPPCCTRLYHRSSSGRRSCRGWEGCIGTESTLLCRFELSCSYTPFAAYSPLRQSNVENESALRFGRPILGRHLGIFLACTEIVKVKLGYQRITQQSKLYPSNLAVSVI